MRIRHLVAASNVDADGWIIDPCAVRHGILIAGRIGELAGKIDPQTHLNLAYSEHRLAACTVVASLAPGAPVLRNGDHFQLAYPRPAAFVNRGTVAVGGQRAAWHRMMQERR
jgi:hypothetical protein